MPGRGEIIRAGGYINMSTTRDLTRQVFEPAPALALFPCPSAGRHV